LSPRAQEITALTLVGLTVFFLSWRTFLSLFAGALSRFLLKSGRVKSAFWIRKKAQVAQSKGCSNCSESAPEGKVP